MKKKVKKHKFRNTVTVVLLVVLCIGGAELAATYWLDRPLFDKITQPIIHKTQDLIEMGEEKLAASKAWITNRLEKAAERAEEKRQEEAAEEAMEEQEIESQKAGDPLLTGGGEAVTDPMITELVIRDGQEILTGGSVSIAYFAQSDPAWKDKSYGADSIGGYGCGPTAMAMAVKSLTDIETDPAKMAQWCAAKGYWAAESGSYHSMVQGVADAYDLHCVKPRTLSANELRMQLSGGRIAVALMKAGHFTSSGHFILLRGSTLDGKILVADPNSRSRSLTAWDAQLIIDELSTSRAAGAPLWYLSERIEN